MSTQPTHGVPSAEYLRSRASALTRIMLTAFEDILSVGHDDEAVDNDNEETADTFARSNVNTAARQTAVDVATNKIVRAAEEYMVLTRTMKELWLFGGLDTLQGDVSGEDEEEKRRQMQRDEKQVVEGMRKWLEGLGERLNRPVESQNQKEGTPMSTG